MNTSSPSLLLKISWYRDGHRVGYAWESKAGGGWVCGKVNEEGQLSGDEMAYLYPDKYTAIVGSFRKGTLVRGSESRLKDVQVEPGERRVWLKTFIPYNSFVTCTVFGKSLWQIW